MWGNKIVLEDEDGESRECHGSFFFLQSSVMDTKGMGSVEDLKMLAAVQPKTLTQVSTGSILRWGLFVQCLVS